MRAAAASIEKFFNSALQKWQRISDFYSDHLKPFFGWIFAILGAVWRWYKRAVWDRFARNKEGSVTRKRAGFTVLGTVLFIWLIPSMLGATWQAGLMATTMKSDEVIYLSNSEEIDPENEVFNVRGCREMPCREANAVYLRVTPSWMHSLHSYATRGHRFYAEDISNVPPGVNRCTVTSYGIRMRWLMRGWGVYPVMLDAVCMPYNGPAATPAPEGVTG